MGSTFFDDAVRAALVTSLAFLATGGAKAAGAEAALCADANQIRAIQERLDAPERNIVDVVARELRLSEAAVMSALPTSRAIGVAGSEFAQVWESLRAWPDAVVLIRKDGHGVMFYGATGDAAFAVYVPSEHSVANETSLAGFEATRLGMHKLRPACPGKG